MGGRGVRLTDAAGRGHTRGKGWPSATLLSPPPVRRRGEGFAPSGGCHRSRQRLRGEGQDSMLSGSTRAERSDAPVDVEVVRLEEDGVHVEVGSGSEAQPSDPRPPRGSGVEIGINKTGRRSPQEVIEQWWACVPPLGGSHVRNPVLRVAGSARSVAGCSDSECPAYTPSKAGLRPTLKRSALAFAPQGESDEHRPALPEDHRPPVR